ncbi:succinyldiaminopimelate transaminase [Neisseria sp. Ec49-e6-T10]|uniref:succinyldiaminopimelate transaminase n=1 Tax=Neisseria sp. Ec49-e6-T10 TaxID=3140744 RepID=UPI003EB9CFB8
MNSLLSRLQPYPFERLRALMSSCQPKAGLAPINLQIGEPKHPTPQLITDALTKNLSTLAQYPATLGLESLRQTCATWLKNRYQIDVCPNTQILPTNGSREALFAFVQTIIHAEQNKQTKPIIISPNPFYQIYEGAAFLAGADTFYVNCLAPDFMPSWDEVPEGIWTRTQLVFVCSPNNPAGSVMQKFDWQKLFALQDQYHFVIASDECYSEIYFEEAPIGCLQAAKELGRSWQNLMMFTSLSKRSNVPGLRSGFVAGDEQLIKQFLLYRTYHGSAMSLPTQYASIAAWSDEKHVEENRQLYQEKFNTVLPILQSKYTISRPDASFYIWLKVPEQDDLAFTQKLWQEASVQVLPGSFLARDTPLGNAGKGYVRIALVAPLEECVEAAKRIVQIIK